MKNIKSISNLKSYLFFIALFLISITNKGQCPYSITNNTNCNYTYDIAWYEFSGGSTCNSNSCNTQIGTVLPAFQSQPITCPCNNYCNIVITITSVNGTSFITSADFLSASPSFTVCTSTGTTLSYNSGTMTFEIN